MSKPTNLPGSPVPDRLRGKVAVVTGAGQGIGAAIVERVAREGAAVAVADVNLAAAESVARALEADGARAIAVGVDIAEPESVSAMAETVQRELGPVTTLVNNAAVNLCAPPLDLPQEHWDRTLAVNLSGAWNCCRALIPQMLEAGSGSVVSISSISGFGVIPGDFPYGIAKHGVVGLAKSFSVEFAGRNLRFNTVSPGYIFTPMLQDWWAETLDDPAAERARVEALHPVRRLGAAEDIATVATFLLSDDAGFITGQDIVVDGGLSLTLPG